MCISFVSSISGISMFKGTEVIPRKWYLKEFYKHNNITVAILFKNLTSFNNDSATENEEHAIRMIST